MMRMGIAWRDITPQSPMMMMGYGDRDHASEGIHDQLRAYALYVDPQDSAPFYWVSADLCLFGPDCAVAIKQAISRQLGISETNIILQGTHTHSGPDAYALHLATDKKERFYYHYLLSQIIEAIQESIRNQKPGKLVIRQGTGSIGVNRRGLEKPVDDRMFLCTLEDEYRKSFGALLYYSCHLTSLGVDNYLLSSDWIGPVRDWFENSQSMPLMYIQGAEGNVDPWTRGVLDMSDPNQALGVSFETMEQISARFSRDLSTVLVKETNGELESIKMARTQVKVPLKYGKMTDDEFEARISTMKYNFAQFLGIDVDDVPEDQSINELVKKHCVKNNICAELTEKYVAEQFSYTQFLWAYRKNRSYIDIKSGSISIPMAVMDAGKIAWIAIPVEPLMDVNLAIKRSVKGKTLLLCGLSDGYFGYLPHEENFYEADADSLYETVSTIFAPSASDVIVNKALELIG
ncbi:neutral/alkaline non-lysosomal ceramidase N-terminal domain-containing protein [Pleomorphochaeta sp. DL1XJH-081]|uniref:neutral/alkaline non-lysosomal ceramidase N-terminal domain-containing protein n=1 Tax=Pleomorphochaeta sp. DL1XJH-081 TaxID=3409690 RepID=UPI003BB68B81